MRISAGVIRGKKTKTDKKKKRPKKKKTDQKKKKKKKKKHTKKKKTKKKKNHTKTALFRANNHQEKSIFQIVTSPHKKVHVQMPDLAHNPTFPIDMIPYASPVSRLISLGTKTYPYCNPWKKNPQKKGGGKTAPACHIPPSHYKNPIPRKPYAFPIIESHRHGAIRRPTPVWHKKMDEKKTKFSG